MDKRTVRRIVATALAVILAEQVFFLICGFGLPVQFGDTFMGELKSKYERLKETSGKRIVLVGGSGVVFDCDSALMDDFFPSYEIVNFGMYAGLGTKAVMDLSENYIYEGDIVILSPEQSEQTFSDYFNGRDAGKFSTVCTGKAELCNERTEASDGQHLSEEIL